ncbi:MULTISPECIES: PRC-barrel domain-containing protein, partial [unclassified Blastococcus]
MITQQQIGNVIGSTAVGPQGKLGTVGEVYLDDSTGRPEWATVRTGLFGTKEAFVPLAEATLSGDELRLPYDKDQVKNSPHHDVSVEGHLSPSEEAELYRYYGIGDSRSIADAVGTARGPELVETASDTTVTTGTTGGYETRGTVGHDTSGPTTDSAMTRSEEHLSVGTRSEE